MQINIFQVEKKTLQIWWIISATSFYTEYSKTISVIVNEKDRSKNVISWILQNRSWISQWRPFLSMFLLALDAYYDLYSHQTSNETHIYDVWLTMLKKWSVSCTDSVSIWLLLLSTRYKGWKRSNPVKSTLELPVFSFQFW